MRKQLEAPPASLNVRQRAAFVLLGIALVGIVAYVACGGSSTTGDMGTPPGSTGPPPVVSPQFASVTFTQTQQFTATSSGSLNWAVDGIAGGNSTVGTISSSGVYTPPQAVGSHTITAGSQSSAGASAQVMVTDYPGVFTQHNDNQRTGQDLQEVVLTPDNVNSKQFGKLFSLSVDGVLYAQPLYMENLKFPDGSFHNALFVATEHDSVYAFDADGKSQSPLWKQSFINPPNVTTMSSDDIGCQQIVPEIGITSTPVIDPSSNTIYVTVLTKELSNPSCTSNCSYNYFYKLHALDLATGAEKFGGPITISATVPGTGAGAQNGQVSFNAFYDLQRPGLLLLNGVIYIGFASHCDIMPYHGWVFAYSASNLKQLAVLNTTPNGGYGGIWQSGGGITADSAGNIYVATGNGTFDADSGGPDYGDSVLKLQLQSDKFVVLSYFTPFNQSTLDANDTDLGSGTPVLLPSQPGADPNLLTLAGKEGRLYLLNADQLSGFHADADQVVQSIPSAFSNREFGEAAFWNGQAYYTTEQDYLKAFTLSGGTFSMPPVSAPNLLQNGFRGSPSVSANGNQDGIVWLIDDSDAGPAILEAYSASNVSNQLYGSDQAAGARDQAGGYVKFSLPTIANGKVYVPTQNEISVYGMLPN